MGWGYEEPLSEAKKELLKNCLVSFKLVKRYERKMFVQIIPFRNSLKCSGYWPGIEKCIFRCHPLSL